AVETGREAADEAGAQHQLMTHHLRLGGSLLHGVERIPGEPHRRVDLLPWLAFAGILSAGRAISRGPRIRLPLWQPSPRNTHAPAARASTCCPTSCPPAVCSRASTRSWRPSTSTSITPAWRYLSR